MSRIVFRGRPKIRLTKRTYPVEKKVRSVAIPNGTCANFVRMDTGSVFCLTGNKKLAYILTAGLINCASVCIILKHGNSTYVFLNHHSIDDMKHINKNIIAKTKNAIQRCVRKKYPSFSLEWKNFLNKPLNYKIYFTGQDTYANQRNSLTLEIARAFSKKFGTDIDFRKYRGNMGVIIGNNIAVDTKTLELVSNKSLGTKFMFYQRENGYGKRVVLEDPIKDEMFFGVCCR
jgi:hypothetical protein